MRLRHILTRAAIAALIAIGTSHQASAEGEQVDALVVTGLDVSSSISAQETALQVDGMAEAVKSPAFVSAIQNGKLGRIGFAVFVWADGEQPMLLDWTVIGDQASAEAAATTIASKLDAVIAENAKKVGTLTDLSAALEHAGALLINTPFTAPRAVVNIVGNGEDNVGEGPEKPRAELLSAGVTINGVVVGNEPDVVKYYRQRVAGGRGNFVLIVDKAEQMTGVMVSKFIADIAMLSNR